MSIFTKEGRKVFSRKVAGFWDEYKRTKVGIAGVIILIIFAVLAIFAPFLTPYDPIISKRLAESFAQPQWVTLFPGNKDLPPTQDIPLYWTVQQSPIPLEWGKRVAFQFAAPTTDQVDIRLVFNFTYQYLPPESFNLKFSVTLEDVKDMSYFLEANLVNTTGQELNLWSYSGQADLHRLIEIQSTDYWWMSARGYTPGKDNVAKIWFAQRGQYSVTLDIRLMPKTTASTISLKVEDSMFNIPGLVHGLLGADNEGRDLWSQLIYGSRISLAIGLLAAGLATSLGIIIGVISGYVGGAVDEIIMRIVDILLALPVLPLLLALIFLFGPNVFYIIFLIAVFGWQGLSRVIRSQVLSLREALFVECARASGASKAYIMFKHLVPNVLPIAFASLVLSVPGAILTEAALSFLGFGDPKAATWGKMLQSAFGFGAFSNLAWWWILPPGLAITFVCLAFVLIGHAVDNIVNPRLRRRR